jgi:hypothetical protein
MKWTAESEGMETLARGKVGVVGCKVIVTRSAEDGSRNATSVAASGRRRTRSALRIARLQYDKEGTPRFWSFSDERGRPPSQRSGSFGRSRPRGKAHSRLDGGPFVEEVEGGLGFLGLAGIRGALGQVFENGPGVGRADALSTQMAQAYAVGDESGVGRLVHALRPASRQSDFLASFLFCSMVPT